MPCILLCHFLIISNESSRKYSRGTRSLGYGFVTFNDDQTASAAISALDKSEFQGRTINVELAKPSTKTSRGNIAQEAAEAAGGEASTEGHEVTGDGQRGARRGVSFIFYIFRRFVLLSIRSFPARSRTWRCKSFFGVFPGII